MSKSAKPRRVKCPYCKQWAQFVRGDQVYPNRRDLREKRFYICKPCDARVGCHPNGDPFGSLANAATRSARSEAHQAFDPLWKSGGMSRSQAYKWLGKAMGLSKRECHIGRFDPGQCQQVVQLVAKRSEVALGQMPDDIVQQQTVLEDIVTALALISPEQVDRQLIDHLVSRSGSEQMTFALQMSIAWSHKPARLAQQFSQTFGTDRLLDLIRLADQRVFVWHMNYYMIRLAWLYDRASDIDDALTILVRARDRTTFSTYNIGDTK